MPIPVTCPSCGTILAAPETAAGKRAKCRNCQAVLTIPKPDQANLDIIDEAATVMETPMKAAPVAFVPTPLEPPAAFGFDEPAPKPKKRPRDEDEDIEDDDERPRKKRRRDEDEDDDEDEKPRGRKRDSEKKGNPLVYVLGAAVAVLLIVIVGIVGVWYTLIREKPVTVDTSILLKPKPTVQTKATVKTPPKDWEVVDDNDLQALFPKAGILEKDEGKIARIDDYPELGEARAVTKIVSRDPLYIIHAYVIYIRNDSLAKVKANPRKAIGEWADLFLIKFPQDDVTGPTDFKTEFISQGNNYLCKDAAGMKHFFRMFVAHDKFYVLHIIGDSLNERSENVKLFFDNFNPTK